MKVDLQIPDWLERLPLAPEFHPTDTEFADPIAYISKIEKDASVFGICKIIPPFPKPSKKYVLMNLNKSLLKCPELGSDVNATEICYSGRTDSGNAENNGELRAVFTTRHQELGQSVNSGGEIGQNSAVHKQVWQSGEIYTLERFESKSKAFARNVLGTVKEVSPIVTEALFWEASSEKSIYVEYANDVPGSGFGEPERPFQCFHKRRRNTAFRGKNRDGCICTKCHIDSISNTHNCTKENLSRKIVPDFDLEASKASCGSLSTLLTDETSKYRHKSSNTSKEIESTAGWKLSNSPWNLQVIAHSSGSLTRFMPDDIPGVTSPMVYIAMLFSWFAWHVEDHELHSLNFLHFGSPKTWYAVPGDYAFAFEEVVRTRAYGGNIDRLATLSLLGEKTTLLSPEVVVASGIPCCRLIQNPGEFVVTFPRAYHVGFSHGFNCGEAANFGTSQWLKVAKEAAVRRAAMNYLPMLSHQQLLYLLTMSFVSRVPRSLLPGSRSSRLRDHQKEERELSVKNAFIKDILDENKLVNVLLRREPSYHAVLWNPDSLPHSIKESRSHSETGTAASAPTENVADIHADNSNQKNLLEGMSLYMDIVNDLYLDDDELPFDFQVDSGSLACVACGILGYPCMSVIQPSKSASVSFLRTDHPQSQGEGKPQYVEAPSFSCPDSLAEGDALDSPANFGKGRTSSSKIFRPRIFCLEHAVQIEELLRPKGGANVLVIYHSDYQKLKAHAAVIAEEIRCPYNFIEVSLSAPSQEDLNSISIALDGEHHDESGEEDWTAKLGINLQHWIKAGKNCSLEQMHHTLACGGAFPSPTPRSNFLIAKWQSRKLRSRSNLKRDTRPKLFEEKEILIQYSRRKPNLKAGSSLKEISEGRSGKSGSSKITTEPENESKSAAMKVKKRKREVEVATESLNSSNGFIRSPCEGLRPRVRKNARGNGTDLSFPAEGKRVEKRMNKLPNFQYLEGLKMRAWRGPTRVLWKAA